MINIKWANDNLVKISLFIIALAAAYYLVIFIPQKNKEQIYLQKQQLQEQANIQKQKDQEQINLQNQKKQGLQDCLNLAEQHYTTNWNGDCPINGLDKKTDGCTLSVHESSRWDSMEQQEKDNCFKQYSQN